MIYQPGVGTNDRSATVYVLNAVVVSGEDGSGTLVAALANQDPQRPDALVSVSGAGPNSGVTVEMDDAPLTLPPGSLVELVDMADIVVDGGVVKAGYLVELRFTFQRSESVTMLVPVQRDIGPYATIPVPSETQVTEGPLAAPTEPEASPAETAPAE